MLLHLVYGLTLTLGIQWVLWAVAAFYRTEKFYDLAGSGTFVLLAHVSLRWIGTKYLRQQIQTGLITLWGIRLGLFLFLRILRDGRDKRFNGVRDDPGTFFIYWTVQGLWIFIALLPSLILNFEKRNKPLGLLDYIGWALWTIGFLTQVVADQQKWHFKSDPDNAGRFIQSGLWAYSRHPNYLGEILQWSGLFISAVSVLRGFQYISIISPLFVWFLLNYVSGIPILEKQAIKRWGNEPGFQSYVKQTPVLWPF
uniref:Steroid 5-alpha reductase C-terminal domain-containing protein n=1 Tax=Leptobrachium leishanense TaxID=445787 RepID=A0A8C5LMK5_9ANUR